MVIYKFYLRDAIKGDVFLGSLPERRRNPERVTENSTEESIMNWVKTHYVNNGEGGDIFFIKTVLEEREKNPSQPGKLQKRTRVGSL